MSETQANLNQALRLLEQFGPQELAVIEERLAARKQNSEQPPDTDGMFDLPFDDYLAMSDEERDAIAFRSYQTLGTWIDTELKKRKAEWILVCGGEVIESSPTLRDYPSDEKLMQIGQQRGLVPFVFVKEPLIEESSWSAITEIHGGVYTRLASESALPSQFRSRGACGTQPVDRISITPGIGWSEESDANCVV